ncbi:MAG: aconitate hydratase [Planctomycetes bacterium]|nr:aconitate hydratase [Planctomycetota bacterium]MBT6452336.1 aconitate hydratase [Planctomycetota bacterium]MBT6540403.1 aconitate hydratase [Planctomycetota bacterium]MBT6785362.1 aconitate hydratase [Planctomycetota bacterium]MBT6968531.1 aconitate hydratase [Planctomycetota bacterium]
MSDPDSIRALYEGAAEIHEKARQSLGRGLTLAEKILLSHMGEDFVRVPQRGVDYCDLHPDRVAMQDATAQMAILQFMQAGLAQVKVPSTVHCDHLIQARMEASQDLAAAEQVNAEVYQFLRSSSEKYGIGFWKPGSGIIHQVVLENYAFPGGLMIGTDSHTPNAGGLGMLAVGVGGADAVDVMAGLPWNVKWPGAIAVKLKGQLSGWTSAKDVILKVAGELTVKGGTGAIVEYIGDGARTISCTGKATITNMGAEIGATCSVFPFDEAMAVYLQATGRSDLAQLARDHAALLRPDPEVEADPASAYDQVLEIDLDHLEPHVVGPHSPDRARPISELGTEARSEGWPLEISAALIGSCTNSSYEDMDRAAAIADQAAEVGIQARTRFLVSPGSTQVFRTVERDGQAASFEKLGGTVLANACGPCIGQWHREDVEKGSSNSIVSSFNRNFPGRNDGNAQTLSFIASPEIVTAFAIAGRLDFNPLVDPIEGEDGESRLLAVPSGKSLPPEGFVKDMTGLVNPPVDGSSVDIEIDPTSERLQLLTPFASREETEYKKMRLLFKAKGKCTTDHISPAGPWLRFRGHLENISKNMFLGAINEFHDSPGIGHDATADGASRVLHEIAANYRDSGSSWVVVGDENYGEGSSREHAAMCPRFMGCGAVIVRSFARIHETNLKKQGVLALRFVDPASYSLVKEGDVISIEGLAQFSPGSEFTAVFIHLDGSEDRVGCCHTFSESQVNWFWKGAALNALTSSEDR